MAMDSVSLSSSSSSKSKTKICQLSNISPTATREQLYQLLGYIGRVDDIKVYPSETNPAFSSISQKLCYVKFAESDAVATAQHLTNTVFIDRALICVPVTGGSIPDEESALKMGGPSRPGQRQLPPTVVNQIENVGDHQQVITIDPTLSALGLPNYPNLPANTDANKIEEIRRTIYVGNLPQDTDTEEIMRFFNDNIGEVMYLRMAGPSEAVNRYAYIEFSHQHTVPTALQNNGIEFKGAKLRIQHSRVAIIKPKSKTQDMVKKEIEEAMRKQGASGGSGNQFGLPTSTQNRLNRGLNDIPKYGGMHSRSRSRTPPWKRRHSPSRSRRSRSRSRDRRRSSHSHRSRRSGSRDRKDKKKRRSRSKSKDKKRDHDKDKKDKDKDKDKEKDKEKGKDKPKDKDKEKDKEKEKDRDRKDRDRKKDEKSTSSSSRRRDRKDDKDKDKSSSSWSRRREREKSEEGKEERVPEGPRPPPPAVMAGRDEEDSEAADNDVLNKTEQSYRRKLCEKLGIKEEGKSSEEKKEEKEVKEEEVKEDKEEKEVKEEPREETSPLMIQRPVLPDDLRPATEDVPDPQSETEEPKPTPSPPKKESKPEVKVSSKRRTRTPDKKPEKERQTRKRERDRRDRSRSPEKVSRKKGRREEPSSSRRRSNKKDSSRRRRRRSKSSDSSSSSSSSGSDSD